MIHEHLLSFDRTGNYIRPSASIADKHQPKYNKPLRSLVRNIIKSKLVDDWSQCSEEVPADDHEHVVEDDIESGIIAKSIS